MPLPELYRCARSLEAIENYASADFPLAGEPETPHKVNNENTYVYRDGEFWDQVFEWARRLDQGESFWGARIILYHFAISEWIPRVPGLFWTDGAAKLRRLATLATQYESHDWRVLHPSGKSDKVVGGIGTLKLPPNEDGRRLVTLSAGHNASSGIPALVSPEVWEHYGLGEGSVVDVAARWQPMAAEWASRFLSMKGIPRGYLVLDDPSQVNNVVAKKSPTQIHPYTVMEYSRGDAILFDFVYATADTAKSGYRKKLEGFFDFYKKDAGRYGRYLLSADISDPLWDADYDSPKALRNNVGAKAQLDLLEARVRRLSFRGQSLELIIDLLVRHYDDDVSLRRLSTFVGIPPAQWFTPGSNVASLSAQFVSKAVEQEKVEVLLDAAALQYPQAFRMQ